VHVGSIGGALGHQPAREIRGERDVDVRLGAGWVAGLVGVGKVEVAGGSREVVVGTVGVCY